MIRRKATLIPSASRLVENVREAGAIEKGCGGKAKKGTATSAMPY
jgi:hypothetical protein